MEDLSLRARLDYLRGTQNPDGGWGYFSGKRSWLEPTVYSALALHGQPEAERAWKLLLTWQTDRGSWRPAAVVDEASWGGALCLTLAVARGEFGPPFRCGLEWLLSTSGSESGWIHRAARALGLTEADRDLRWRGWPWKPGTSSWVEPTAHALIALKRTPREFWSATLGDRIHLAEGQLFDVRCRDGGWNYGSQAALRVDLPSYPETTALALLGLQGRRGLMPALERAAGMAREARSPLARAWLSISLRAWDRPAPPPAGEPTADIMVTALEALSAPEGNYRLLKTESKV